jgi:hypothetical protein
MKLTKEKLIENYEYDLKKWQSYLLTISEPDTAVEKYVDELKEAIEYIKTKYK